MALSLLAGCGKGGTESTVGAASEQNSLSGSVSSIMGTELFTDEDAFPIDLNKESGVVNITAPGNYVLSGALKGQVIVNVADEGKTKLILNGAEITNENEPCIYVLNADKAIVASAEGSVNSLETKGEFIARDANNADAVIFSQDDLNLNGDGIINIKSEQGHGVVSKDELKIKDGEVNVTAYKKGLNGKDALTVEGGTINVQSRTHALSSTGDIEISGGELTVSSFERDGIHTDGNVVISDGIIKVSESAEAIEGLTVTISGGELNLVSSDDGINSSASNDNDTNAKWQIGGNPFLVDDGADITISGGTIIIDAGGDGIDSNGTLNMTGGELYISASTREDNGAVDYASEAVISGGKVVAAGASGMAEGFGSNSEQGNILYNSNTEYKGGTAVTLYDDEGNALVSFTPAKDFSSVLLSSPEIVIGKNYTIVIGEDSADIYMSEICYSTGGRGRDMLPGGGMHFGQPPQGFPGKPPEGPPPDEKPASF